MMKNLTSIFILTLFSCFSANQILAQTPQLMINEIMQSNVDVLFDEREFPDSWVELYNPTNHTIDLQGWMLSDGIDTQKFTSKEIPSGGYALIYCDKEDLPFHTPFRVESGKGALYLYDPSGLLVDEVSFKKMIAPNIVYGRIGDAADKWGYLMKPTPGYENDTDNTKELLPAPVFSHPGGLCSDPFELQIAVPDGLAYDGLNLCVTTDGREPTLADAIGANRYIAQIDSSVAVRAKLFASNAHSPLSTTHSYIFHPRPTSLPITSLAIDKDYLLDENEGILTEGPDPDNPNYLQKHRKPLNAELFIDGEQLFNQVGEIRVSGFSSAGRPQKPFILYANKRFGTKRYNTTDVWPDKTDITEVKSFMLRTGGFHPLTFSEAMLQLLISRSGLNHIYIQAYRPTITYINGRYAGIYNIRERTDEDWMEANFPDVEEFDMVENWENVKAGSRENLRMALYDILNPNTCTLETLEKYFNVECLVNSFAYQLLIGNFDYCYNNIVFWRIEDGKWNILFKDLDMGAVALPDFDLFQYIKGKLEEFDITHPWRNKFEFFDNLTKIPEVREMLYKKIAFMLGDFMQMENFINIRDELAAEVVDEIPYHCELYKPWGITNLDGFYRLMNSFTSNYEGRHQSLWPQMQEHLNAPSSFSLTVEAEDLPLVFNGDRMQMPSFNGRYFLDTPLSVATIHPFKESYAEITEIDNDDNVKIYDIQEVTDKVFADVKSVNILFKEKSGINSITDDEHLDDAPIEYFDITGRKVDSSAKGIVIRRQGRTVSKELR